jgi:cobalt-zinc-cadmium efflux system outer membrane protein
MKRKPGAAARYNVSIAEAQLVAARVFPNPTLNGGTSGRDVTHRGELREPANDDAGVTQTIELGGKRRKRVAVAQANLAQAAATLEDFFRMLRGNAATAFVDALTKRRIAEEKLRSAGALDQLVAANRKRLEVGDIGESSRAARSTTPRPCTRPSSSATSTAPRPCSTC